jgi:hypothetical protein
MDGQSCDDPVVMDGQSCDDPVVTFTSIQDILVMVVIQMNFY